MLIGQRQAAFLERGHLIQTYAPINVKPLGGGGGGGRAKAGDLTVIIVS